MKLSAAELGMNRWPTELEANQARMSHPPARAAPKKDLQTVVDEFDVILKDVVNRSGQPQRCLLTD